MWDVTRGVWHTSAKTHATRHTHNAHPDFSLDHNTHTPHLALTPEQLMVTSWSGSYICAAQTWYLHIWAMAQPQGVTSECEVWSVLRAKNRGVRCGCEVCGVFSQRCAFPPHTSVVTFQTWPKSHLADIFWRLRERMGVWGLGVRCVFRGDAITAAKWRRTAVSAPACETPYR